jgi:hypothetical protein
MTMTYDMHGKLSKWPEEFECGQDGCKELAWMTEDQGAGFVGYECPVHGSFGVQFDDPDDDLDNADGDEGFWDQYYDDEEYADDAYDWEMDE